MTRRRLCSCIKSTWKHRPLPGSRLTGQAFRSRRLQRHSYASTSAPFSQNSDSTSANRTSPSPRRNSTVSAACFLGVFRLPNMASHRLSAALVSLTCRCTAHSISSRRSGVANSGELRMRVVMRAEIGWDGRLIESPGAGQVRKDGNDIRTKDVRCRLTSLNALAQRQPHVHHFLLARAREKQAD